MTRLVFLDCETTGLDPDRHEVWEAAFIVRDPQRGADDVEHRLLIKPRRLDTADPGALRTGRYYQRAAEVDASTTWVSAQEPIVGVHDTWVAPPVAAERVATITAGAHLVGANPAFDAAHLTTLLAAHGLVPAWHYRLVDVEALVAGAVRWDVPQSLGASAERLNVEVPDAGRHTALGDARTARDVYDAVIAPREGAASRARAGAGRVNHGAV